MDRFTDEAVYNQQKAWESEQEFYASESAKAQSDIEANEEMSEKTMTELLQELREGIACLLCGALKFNCDFHPTIDAIECPQHLTKADQINAFYAEKGACFPASGELPENPHNGAVEPYMGFGYNEAQRDMLKAGYKFVKTLKEMENGNQQSY